ncbi:MAG TPA: LamB/YcsF family protein [Pseudomonadales bacterium]
MIHLNCDIGEQPDERERDLALLALVDAVSIACGGHAGDQHSAMFWRDAASAHNKACHLHLGYPDREHFGRRALHMPWAQLAGALSQQRALLAECTTVKFHGALYNQAAADPVLAASLAQWCVHEGITALLAPPASALADAGQQQGLRIYREGFADRRYQRDGTGVRLMPRSEPAAVHDNPAAVLGQIHSVLAFGQLPLDDGVHPFDCDTWCIHSDSPAALLIARAIRERWS